MVAKKAANRVARLSAFAQPVLHALVLELHERRAFSGDHTCRRSRQNGRCADASFPSPPRDRTDASSCQSATAESLTLAIPPESNPAIIPNPARFTNRYLQGGEEEFPVSALTSRRGEIRGRIFVGRSFSYDISVGAQRLQLAVLFPRAFALPRSGNHPQEDRCLSQQPERQCRLRTMFDHLLVAGGKMRRAGRFPHPPCRSLGRLRERALAR